MSGGDSARSSDTSNEGEMDRVEVYLRLKPIPDHEETVVEIEDPQTIVVNPQMAAQLSGQRQLASQKPVRYTFEYIFPSRIDQAEVFHRVAIPSIRDVLSGKPALIFMYGVTGSGKTYTMGGTPQNAGILPRTLDVLFNSLPLNLKAMKFLFKPDGLNSYDIRNEADAMADRQNAMLALREGGTQSFERTPAKKKQRIECREWLQRERDSTRVAGDIPEFCKVAVFVQYVEIYKDYVYDLLEEEPVSVQSRARGPQARLVREDTRTKSMFVLGATEIEVENADEAVEVWMRGQRRKRVASTLMNAESSRSHSVFIVKIVQAPVDEKSGGVVQKREHVTVNQLNLVDLAGCERQTKTGAIGDRLKEANNINQSLAVLRKCLELLRENQTNPSANRNIPFRESKLTYLFKSFFEGRGRVKMVVCVNPRAEDCSQTLEVMKFSETAQEIELQRVQPIRVQQYNEPTPASSVDDLRMPALFESTEVPSCLTGDADDEAAMIAIMKMVEEGAKEWDSTRAACYEALKAVKEWTKEWEEERRKLKTKLLANEKERKQQARTIKDLLADVSQERREKEAFKEKIIEIESKSEYAIKRTHQLEEAYRKAKDEQVRIKKDMELKWSKEKDLLLSKADKQLNEQRATALRQGAELAKAGLIKDILERDEFKHVASTGTGLSSAAVRSRTPKRPQPLKQRTREFYSKLTESQPKLDSPETFHTLDTHRGVVTPSSSQKSAASTSEPDLSDMEGATAKIRNYGPTTRSRSKSSDARWLEHTNGMPGIANDALMQPHMQRKKSVAKLETKDLQFVDKYALVTNAGEHVQVVKGEVLTSPTGGRSIVFSEVETLKREKVNGGGSSKRKEAADAKGYVGPTQTKKRVSGIDWVPE
ncbi:kinesin protein KIF23-like [Tropilaelaps mercedesae]|uniref:Kinesin protein KIF23-like n=1 Tax=Tropilaelaps mercedesae TaxID=418985 RepID=A0A1V9WZJ6_9ACAR|nr:kinesin protein KIF23-like [Tropilaelaps mercedesae]